MEQKSETIFPNLNESPFLSEEKQIENIINNIHQIEDKTKTASKDKDLFDRFGLVPKTVIIEPENNGQDVKSSVSNNNIVVEETRTILKKDIINNEIDNNNDVKYDVITLPSEGKTYRHKKKRIEIAYLTASDEDILTSPNLYQSGLMIPKIIRKKVLNRDIDTSELIPGDIDYIMIWLRRSAYGDNYPVIVKDPSGKEFETIINLSKLKIKKCLKESDENGYFTFETKTAYKNIKYKILSYQEQKEVEEIILKGLNDSNKHTVYNQVNILAEYLETVPEEFNGKDKIRRLIKETTEFLEKYSLINTDTSNLGYSKNITSFLEKQVVEINGITNPLEIKKLISNMPVGLSRELRKDIKENTPGFDYEIEVEVPGGEPIKSFFQIGPDILWGLD